MGYAKIIDANLNLAFNQLKDLAKNVTFRKKAPIGFDFGSAEMDEGQAADTIIKAVVIDNKKTSEKHNPTKKEILFKSRGVGDITMYDSIIIDNETWKIGPIISNNGYIVFAEIFKEG